MNSNGADNEIPDQFEYIKKLSFRMQPKQKLKLRNSQKTLADGFHPWSQLLPSFSSSVTQTAGGPWLSVKDWNPFSQQLPVYFTQTTDRQLERDFHYARELISNFHLTFHESIHVALWEPFFLGDYSIESQHQFNEVSLAFEAAAFWFTDCVTAPALRRALPDVELLRNRFAVTNDFLPYRAFMDAGIKRERDGFDLYQLAFTGFQTTFWKSNSLFANAIARRLYGFYASSLTPLKRLYHSLGAIGVFDEFSERFTRPDLPTLFSKKVRDRLRNDGQEEYSWTLLNKKTSSWQSLSPAELLAVRIRRGLQGRAYKAMSLRYALSDDRCFGQTKQWSNFENEDAISRINLYLSALESGLNSLADRELKATIRQIQQADKNLEILRTRFKRHDLRTGVRDFILPELSERFSQFGRPTLLEKRRRPLTKKEISAVLQLLLQKEDGMLTQDSERLKLASKISENLNGKNQLALRRYIDRALMHRDVLPRWSVALSSFDPKLGLYSEPVFKYD